ncbi:MAG TPA: glycosyltransferase 87 family protein [Stellaceae bacterium]|nr:glycosyltransferase 87 family protein [Stellaceae bacterium]
MSVGGWRSPTLIAIGALMLVLTGIGLLLQRENAHDSFIVLALAQGMLYLLAVALTWRGGFSRNALIAVLAVAALMRFGVLLALPYLSDDINRYIWDGRVEAAGINPYRYIPVDPHLAALRDDVIFPNVNRSTYAPTIYPPVAEYVFLIATRVSESLTWMRAMMVGSEVATIVLLLRLFTLFNLPRERILIYAWHPLALWEFSGSGHIDAAAVTFVMLALWARRRDAMWLTGSALAAAALVKFLPAVILPALYRRWDWKLPAAALATTVAAYVPFLGVGGSVFGFLPGYLKEEDLATGSGFFLWNLLKRVAPIGELGATPYLALAAAVMAALGGYVVLRDKAAADYITPATILAVVATVLLSPHYAWYFVWLVPFLCFVPYPSVLYLTVASPLLYFVPGGPDPHGARLAYEAAIYGPFAVLACLDLLHGFAARAGTRWIRVDA